MNGESRNEAREFSRRLILLCEEFNFEILAQFGKVDGEHSITLLYSTAEEGVNTAMLLACQLDCLAAKDMKAVQAAMMASMKAFERRGINRSGESITGDGDGRSLLDRLGFEQGGDNGS